MRVECDASHRYFYNGSRYPGVSDLIPILIGKCKVCEEKYFPEAVAEEGSALHKLADYFDSGGRWDSLPSPLKEKSITQRFWGAYRGLVETTIPVAGNKRLGDFLTKSEKESPAINLSMGFCGTPDRCLESGFIFDLKSGAEQKWHRLQVILYWILKKKKGSNLPLLMNAYFEYDIFRIQCHRTSAGELDVISKAVMGAVSIWEMRNR